MLTFTIDLGLGSVAEEFCSELGLTTKALYSKIHIRNMRYIHLNAFIVMGTKL